MPSSPADFEAGMERRKADHIEICATADVEHRERSTLLEEFVFLHDSLPELNADDIRTDTVCAGKRLSAPLVITGMTGGTDRAADINRRLAAAAQKHGLAFGLGSQRAMLRDSDAAASYIVRDVAPDILLLGNIGAVQARDMTTSALADLVGAVEADALCVHLNPAQELIQPNGDRDFRGCLDAIGRLCDELPVPVIAKETGAGMSRTVLARLRGAGVRHVDVSGAGGTTWTGVETLRSSGPQQETGKALWSWGIPTAPCVGWAVDAGFHTIASGGIRDGHDVARAIGLGADLVGAALPWLRAVIDGGDAAVDVVAESMVETLRAVMLLTGSSDLAALRRAPRVIGPELSRWLQQS